MKTLPMRLMWAVAVLFWLEGDAIAHGSPDAGKKL